MALTSGSSSQLVYSNFSLILPDFNLSITLSYNRLELTMGMGTYLPRKVNLKGGNQMGFGWNQSKIVLNSDQNNCTIWTQKWPNASIYPSLQLRTAHMRWTSSCMAVVVFCESKLATALLGVTMWLIICGYFDTSLSHFGCHFGSSYQIFFH